MVCSTCDKDLPETDFHSKGNGKKHKQCKFCKRIAQQRHYANHKADYIARAKTKNKEIKAEIDRIIVDAKSQPCKDCGEFFPPCAMDFDHTADDKLDNVADLVRYHSVRKVLEEIAKCDVVCACCHRVRTHNRRN